MENFIISTRSKKYAFLLLVILSGGSCSKSKSKGTTDSGGPVGPMTKSLTEASAKILWEDQKEKAIPELGMTLVKIKAWQSFSRTVAPTSFTEDVHWVEFWFKLDDENVVHYYRTQPFYKDKDGNLFDAERPPGIEVTHDYYAPTVDPDLPNKQFFVSQISNPDSFVDISPIVTAQIHAKGNVTDPSYQEVVYNVSDPKVVTNSPWENLKNIDNGNFYPNLFSRERYEINTGNLTGKIGCAVSKITTNAWPSKKTFLFGDIELGNYVDKNGNNSAVTANRDDDDLVVRWDENWTITGINVSTKKVRIVREKMAPLYLGRTLKANIDDTTPHPSKFEGFLRSCNKASETVGSQFQIWSFAETSAAPSFKQKSFLVSDENTFCQTWESASDAAKFGNIINAATAPVGSFACTFPGVEFLTTDFNGTKYTANSGETAFNVRYHRESTPIIEVQF